MLEAKIDRIKSSHDYFSICPICRRSELKLVYKFADFSVMKCKACGNSWRTNMYSPDRIKQMYSSEAYEKEPFFAYDRQDLKNKTSKRFQNYARALTHMESAIGVGKLLDVACGSGAFLAIAQRRGWNVDGLELSPALCRACERNTNIQVTNSSFEEARLPERSYDAVTFWDIIEHVVDPASCLEKARALVRPGGLILFCTPDEHSLLARLGWALYKLTGARYSYPALALHPMYHTYFFSKASFVRLLEEKNLRVVRVYSQEAFFEHSPLANGVQKRGIAITEKVGALFDACYEMVVLAAAA